MNLAMFHDWIIYKDRTGYYLDDAFSKFVTAFDQDFDNLIFCGRVVTKKAGTNIYRLNSAKHRVCPFPYYKDIYSLYTRGVFILPQIMDRVKKNIDQWDVVWLEAPHPIGIMTAWLCQRRHKPFFFLVRENLHERVRHRTRGAKRTVSLFMVQLLERFSQKLSRGALTFTVGQEMLRRYQRKHCPVAPVIISLISEQDVLLDIPQKPGTLEGPIRLLWVGRLDPEKGLMYLIEAVDRLVHREKKQILLTIVGKGKEESFLKQEVQRRGLSQRVCFPGYIKNGPDLLHLYREHDLFVLPSLTGEGLPQTILEAMACAIPVIATRVEGIPYFIRDRANGLLIPPADAGAIFQAVLTVTNNDTLRNQIIKGGLKTVRSHTLEIERSKMMDQMRRFLLTS